MHAHAQKLDPRMVQINLTPFLEKNTTLFCKVRGVGWRGCGMGALESRAWHFLSGDDSIARTLAPCPSDRNQGLLVVLASTNTVLRPPPPCTELRKPCTP